MSAADAEELAVPGALHVPHPLQHIPAFREEGLLAALLLCVDGTGTFIQFISFFNYLYAPKGSISPGCDFRTLKLHSFCVKIHKFFSCANKNPAEQIPLCFIIRVFF